MTLWLSRGCGLFVALLSLTGICSAETVFSRAGERFIIPDAIAGTWESVEGLSPLPERSTARVTLQLDDSLQGGRTRLDIFTRRADGNCVWSAAYGVAGLSELHVRAQADAERECYLVRNGPLYGVARSDGEWHVPALRDVHVAGDDDHLLAVVGGELPRRFSRHGRTFEAVPVAPSLLCRWSSDDDECTALPPAATRASSASSDAAIHGSIRLFRLENQASPQVSAHGSSYLRPKNIRPRVLGVGEWTAMVIDEPWSAVVVDWQSSGKATVRVSGNTLAPLPFHHPITQHVTDGIALRPLIDGETVLEQDAAVVFFFDTRGESLPAAVVSGTDGIFRAPSLAPGTYGLKLISSLSAADMTTVSFPSVAPTEAAFRAGPLVRGRVVMRGASAAGGLPIVHVLRHRENRAEKEAPADPAATMREVYAEQDGAFRFSVAPGKYSLRVSWAGAIAGREFEIGSVTREIDLGDIDLQGAHTLVGRVLGACKGGELQLMPLPSAGRLTAMPFFEIPRSAISPDGSFSISALAPGQWLATAMCGGAQLVLEPQVIDVPVGAGETLVVDFTAQP